MSLNYDDIVKDTDAIVRTKSEPVTLPLGAEDEALLQDMLTYVRSSQDAEIAEKENLRPAVGIAAIQLGVPKECWLWLCPMRKELTNMRLSTRGSYPSPYSALI